MNIPKLRKKPEIKKYHGASWEDPYSWIHQQNILEVLKDEFKIKPRGKTLP